MAKKESKKEVNPFVQIVATLGGIYVAVVALVLIFSPMDELLISIAWAFVVLGVVASYFAYKAQKK